MIKARHTWFHTRFFELYTRQMLRRHFSSVTIAGEVDTEGAPVLVLSNHFSWWDGFVMNYLNFMHLHKRFHVMMLEEELSKRMFLNKAGAYSIRKNARSLVESLNYTAGLLENPGNMAVLYPQGKIQSLYHYPLRFERGISRVLAKIPEQAAVVFAVVLVDYFSQARPQMRICLKQTTPAACPGHKEAQTLFNEFMLACIHGQTTDN